MNKKIKEELKKILTRSKVSFDEPMYKHTSLRIGGPADAFVLVEGIDELKKILTLARRKDIPLFTIGGGTNLLVNDRGIKGIVLKLGKSFDRIKFRGNKVLAGPSVPVAKLLKETVRHNLSGLECMAGIPGTLGGAIIANAGSPERAIGDFISSVKLMTPYGRIMTRRRNALQFSYRYSSFKNERGVIVGVVLNSLMKRSRAIIEKQIAFIIEKRRKNQPAGFPSAGCIFKNPPISSAGVLIDFAGLKGLKIGGAQISKKHANFILNVNSAKSSDVSKLIEKVERKIYDLFRIELELEVENVG